MTGHVTANMLRYYILSFLLNIHLTFCYDYLKNDEANHRPRANRRYEKRNPLGGRAHAPRYGEPLARFDVASFIQNSGDAAGGARYADQKHNRRFSKDYYTDYDVGLKVNDNHRDSWKDYLDMPEPDEGKMKPSVKPLAKATYGRDFDYNSAKLNDLKDDKRMGLKGLDYFSENMYRNSILEDSAVHHPEKKGVLKNFKFPFFFHNKTTVMVSPKKAKKRKPFQSSKAGKSKHSLDANPEEFVAESLYGVDAKYIYNKKKRSYIESLCPVCKKMYVEKLKLAPKTRHVTDRIVHNSRQFYQNLFAGKKINGKKNVDVSSDYLEQIRYKRQRFDDKERQLKEIEEVTKKIEGVEVDTNPTTRNFDTDSANVTRN